MSICGVGDVAGRGRLEVEKRTEMDERLSTVRAELETGSVSSHSLVLLFNAASEAEHAADLPALERALELARTIARQAGENLRAEAERLVAICDQSLATVRQGQNASSSRLPDGMIACPDCGNEVPADALRCRRCGRLFLE
jgi:hypothetical protein